MFYGVVLVSTVQQNESAILAIKIKLELKVKGNSLNYVQLFATAWTIQSMEFSRPEHWSG